MPKEKVIHYPNGAIKEKKYLLEGKIHGQYTTYFPSGQIMAQLHFSSGKKNGSAVSYYANGQVRRYLIVP